MTEQLNAFGHLLIILAFIILLIDIRRNQRTLRRTIRHSRWVYRTILAVAVFSGLANGVWLIYFAADLEVHTALGWSLSSLTHLSILLLVFTVAVLIRSKLVGERVEGRRRILAIGAHPDDLEIACGGTLARLCDEGHLVAGLILTHGSQGGDSLIRQMEAQNGASFLGLHDFTLLNLPDTNLDLDGVRQAIEEKVQAFRPDIIFTHSEHDQHQDHQIIHQATLQAGRRVNTILCYESPSTTLDFKPSLFIEIGDYVDVKIESIREHQNQARKAYMDAALVRSQARVRGEQTKTHYAEGFEVRRALMMEGGIL
ncbi:MAG: PIG-L family deacetylase [Chloroflexi bacterium]|nr:PIG-L family deacetylase [Chloroflexota bacterium]